RTPITLHCILNSRPKHLVKIVRNFHL
ncbi:hypothetical protein CP061683_0994, partial [Chlamydia psittaci 06-1683]